jgi:hypothetical protein
MKIRFGDLNQCFINFGDAALFWICSWIIMKFNVKNMAKIAACAWLNALKIYLAFSEDDQIVKVYAIANELVWLIKYEIEDIMSRDNGTRRMKDKIVMIFPWGQTIVISSARIATSV